MYKHILIATDGSELGQKGVGQGISLARALGAKATVVTVTEPFRAMGDMVFSYPVTEYDKAAAAGAQTILGSAVEIARKAGISCETLHVKDHFPAEGIIETANRLGCDLIVMSSHGRRGISRMLLGSQANKVVTLSEVPVLICR